MEILREPLRRPLHRRRLERHGEKSRDTRVRDARSETLRPAGELPGAMFYDRGSYAFAAGTLARMVSVKARMIEFLT